MKLGSNNQFENSLLWGAQQKLKFVFHKLENNFVIEEFGNGHALAFGFLFKDFVDIWSQQYSKF